MARRYRVSEATISRLLAAYRAQGPAAGARGQVGTDEAIPGRIVGALPVSALDERLAIVGTSGSGKTYAAKGLVERLLEQGARACVVDPLGVRSATPVVMAVPWLRRRACTAPSALASRATRTTSQPSRASASATAAPMPLDAPVTTALRPPSLRPIRTSPPLIRPVFGAAILIPYLACHS